MKKYRLVVFLFMTTILCIQSQDMEITCDDIHGTYILSIGKNSFYIYKSQDRNNENIADIISIDPLGYGLVKKQDKIYELYDTREKKTYIIREIDKDKLLNINVPYLLKDTLYVNFRKSQKHVIIGNWKNRKRDGIWTYLSRKSAKIELHETYKEGKLIKTTYPDK